ncbi:MAG: metallophosphoesterase [Oscillospiraceae bacterium]|nr:metallophosphoesterase [Oscillospiraceae bacterium]
MEEPNCWADQPTPASVCAALPSDAVRVLLAHRNYWTEEYPDLPVELILCGHAHGGVIRLPFLGGVLDHYGPPFPDYTDGVYRSGRYDMVVSRGLGNTGGVPRFLNNPELVIVTLKSQ